MNSKIVKCKAILDQKEQEMVWKYAELVNGEDSDIVRKDFLGAEIHKSDYDKNTNYGWCAEMILSPSFLEENSLNVDNKYCEANLRVLNIGK